MSKYGYIGKDGPTQAIKSNAGVLTPKEHRDLIINDKLFVPGQLELIETQTISSGSTLNFTNIKEHIYNVHFATANNVENSSANTSVSVRLSNDGGTSYEAGTSYQLTLEYATHAGVNGEVKSTGTSYMEFLSDTANENRGGYIYFYNLGDSTKYSLSTYHQEIESTMSFGNSAYKATEKMNAIQFLTTNGNAWTGTISLYGLRYYT